MVLVTKIRNNRSKKLQELHKDILDIIGGVINDEDFKKLKSHRHHVFFNRYEHLINASIIAHKISKFLKADVHSCTLAGILHDYHFTKFKGYKHGLEAAKNAEKFNVNEKVLEIIKCHMYPFGRSKIPRHKGIDFWVVKSADFLSMCYEIGYSILFLSFKGKNKIKLKKNRLLLDLLEK
ncbi:MAG: HD domain-containing protein [Candidatus Gracilibacteria bacterium]|nr:HD domain-containing protein [Candidatus Gracilibacteria bacterium]